MTGDPRYHEHEKLWACSRETQAAGEFLDWLAHEKGLHLSDKDYAPCCTPLRDLLAEWKGIDQRAIEREKRAMLDEMRAMNSEVSHG